MAENPDKARQNERVSAGEWRRVARAANGEAAGRDVTASVGHWRGEGWQSGALSRGRGRQRARRRGLEGDVESQDAGRERPRVGRRRRAHKRALSGGAAGGRRRLRRPFVRRPLFGFLFPEKKVSEGEGEGRRREGGRRGGGVGGRTVSQP